jgi:hypothetical protein
VQRRNSILWPVLLSLASLAGSRNPSPYTPPPGDQERQVTANALRAPVDGELCRQVIFKVDQFKARANCAFMYRTLLYSDSRPMDHRGTPYQQAIDDGLFNDWTCSCFIGGATNVRLLST